MLSKRSQTEGQILGYSTDTKNLEESDSRGQSRRGAAENLGRGNGELVFNGDRASVWECEKALGVDGGDDSTTI